MKKTLLGAFTAFALLSVAKGATTITAFNYVLGGSGYAHQIVNNDLGNTPFAGGTVMIGTFSNPTGLGTALNVTLAEYGWSMFASAAFNTLASQPGLFGANGATGNLPTTAGGAFIGNEIYAVIANAAGTDFIIFNSNKLFATEVEGLGGAAISFSTRDVTTELVRGQFVTGGNKNLANAAGAFNGGDAITFGVAVPEPSAALLGAVGALGLLRRRRN